MSGESPRPGDVLRIHARAPMRVEVREVSEFEPGFWKVRAEVLEGANAGGEDVWHLYRDEFDHETRTEETR